MRANPGLFITFEAEAPVAVLPSGRKWRLSPRLVLALSVAATPARLDAVARRAGISEAIGQRLLEEGLLCSADAVHAPEFSSLSAEEWVVQRASGRFRLRAARGSVSRPPPVKPADRAALLRLQQRPTSPLDLAELSLRRRSSRRFGTTPLRAADLGTLLHETAWQRRRLGEDGSSRGYPSGGGRHPLEVYICAIGVAGVPRAVYRYAPDLDGLQRWRDLPLEDLQDLLARANGWTGGMVGRPAVVAVVTAVFARTAWRYENGVLLTIYRDAGCLLHAFAVASAALGLACCPIAGDGEAERARWLGLDPTEESQVALCLVGSRPTDPTPVGRSSGTGVG